jgi:hypothetical protein
VGDCCLSSIKLTKGANQFTWNLLYPETEKLDDLILWNGVPGNILAIPGSYSAVIRVGNDSVQVPFSILPDPNYSCSAADYASQLNFLQDIQKKFNLIIYPDKKRSNNFIVETFNNWYNKGNIIDIGDWVDNEAGMTVVPANELAVNQLNFGDTLDLDYYSQQFAKKNNREYGKTYYLDTENFFSQGTFEVKTGFASVPLLYVAATGVSGAATPIPGVYTIRVEAVYITSTTVDCFGVPTNRDTWRLIATYYDSLGNPTINFGGDATLYVQFYETGTTLVGLNTSVTVLGGAGSGQTDFFVYDVGNNCGFTPIDPTTGCVQPIGSYFGLLDPISPIQMC